MRFDFNILSRNFDDFQLNPVPWHNVVSTVHFHENFVVVYIFVFFTQVSERGKNQTCEWPIRLHHGCDKSTLGPVQNLRLPTFSLPLLLKNRNLLPAPHAYVTGKFVGLLNI